MAVGPLARLLCRAQPGGAASARVVRGEMRAPVCGRHGGVTDVSDFWNILVSHAFNVSVT